MLTFRTLQLSDRAAVQKALERSGFQGCEYSFANNLAWRRAADTKAAFFKDFYICASFDSEDGGLVFYYPSGSGELKGVIREMAETAAELRSPLRIAGVTKDSLSLIRKLYGESFAATLYPDGFDYIYETYDLIEMPGKKFHKKRGALTQFRRNYENYSFSEITPNDFDECIAMSARFYNEKHGYIDRSSIAEQFAIHTYFSYFDELQLKGGVLRVGGNIVGFSIGERLTDDTFVTHIEKADIGYRGAYTALTQAFTAEFAAGYRYINREEDLGIEGLRKAKRAWQPAYMLEKYMCVFDCPQILI